MKQLMFDQGYIEKFLNILKREVQHFGDDFTYDIVDDRLTLRLNNSTLFVLIIHESKCELSFDNQEVVEKDLVDGMVRLRFEVMRSVNPTAFKGFA